MSRLDNKIAIITGGANGFGAAMVEHFVALGAKVAFGDIATAAGEASSAHQSTALPCG